MKNQEYLDSKNSGITWLGCIPSHWDIKPMKYLADYINGDVFNPSEWSDSGVPIIRIQNLNGSEDFNFTEAHVEERYQVRKGALLFGWSGNRGTSFGPFLWPKAGVFALNQHIFKVIPHAIEKGFFYWALKAVTAHVEEQAHGIIGMVHITKSDLGVIRIPIPSAKEQDSIAAFLDRETAKIDTLIAEQRTLIERLREKRLAEVTRAVTEGIDPSVQFKASGARWFGSVPAHWEIKQIRHITLGLDQGWSPQAEDREADPEEWAVIKLSAIKQGRFIDSEHKTLPSNLDIPVGLEIRPGDLLFTRANTPELVGDVCVVGKTRSRLLFSDLVFRPRLDPNQVDAKFLMYFLLSRCGRAQIECTARGSSQSMVKISQGMINSWQIPLPALTEQKEIVAALDRDMGSLDRLISEADTSIALLQEHRAALITAVVTGKVDVRGLVTGASA